MTDEKDTSAPATGRPDDTKKGKPKPKPKGKLVVPSAADARMLKRV